MSIKIRKATDPVAPFILVKRMHDNLTGSCRLGHRVKIIMPDRMSQGRHAKR